MKLYEDELIGQIAEFPNYIITSYGRIWSKHHKKWLKLSPKNHNYIQVTLCNKTQQKIFYVHRLVATLFIPNPNNYVIVNHKDENPMNNHMNNLEWTTQKSNCNYGNHNINLSKARCRYLKQNPPLKRGDSLFAKKIYMCDKTTHDVIQVFDSVSSACDYLHKEKGTGNIVNVLKNRTNSAYGYFWKYVKEEEDFSENY